MKEAPASAPGDDECQGVLTTPRPVKEQQLRLQLLARQAKDRDGDDPMLDIDG